MQFHLVVTAEHGGNDVPAEYAALFQNASEVLRTHRGWDPGTLELGRLLSKKLKAPYIAATVTRLLVDLNRSPHHRSVFSEFTRDLPRSDRQELLSTFHTPHRSRVAELIGSRIEHGECVLHLGMHSFTPVLNDEVRQADIGLLYDPKRTSEREFSRQWQAVLRRNRPDLRVRLNYPYRGAADGLTTSLRRLWPANQYLGIELEVNQSLPQGEPDHWARLQADLIATLRDVLHSDN